MRSDGTSSNQGEFMGFPYSLDGSGQFMMRHLGGKRRGVPLSWCIGVNASRGATVGDSLGRKSQVAGIFNSKSRGATAGVTSATGLCIRNNLFGVPVVALRLAGNWGHATSDLHPRNCCRVATERIVQAAMYRVAGAKEVGKIYLLPNGAPKKYSSIGP